MELWTEVKCHNCSRVCGEAEGSQPRVWVLSHVERLLPVIGCGVRSQTDLRCSRCGGRLYPDETYTQAAETHSSQVTASHYSESPATA